RAAGEDAQPEPTVLITNPSSDHQPTSEYYMAGKKRKSSPRSAQAPDAVALLKADHRQVEGWFAQFGKSRSNTRRQQLADQICAALRVHTEIEEEIFYPAFLKATADKDMHHEAVVEHAGAK